MSKVITHFLVKVYLFNAMLTAEYRISQEPRHKVEEAMTKALVRKCNKCTKQKGKSQFKKIWEEEDEYWKDREDWTHRMPDHNRPLLDLGFAPILYRPKQPHFLNGVPYSVLGQVNAHNASFRGMFIPSHILMIEPQKQPRILHPNLGYPSVLPPPMQHQFSTGIPNFGHYQDLPSHMGGGMQNAFTGIVVPLHMLMIDPQKQRLGIPHPNLAVSRHGDGTQTTIDAVHQNMQQQSNMPILQQFFQNSMPTGNRGSVSAAAVPATMMLQEVAPQQVMPQQMPQQMMSQVPTVPWAAPLPYGHDLSPGLTRQFQGMDLGALAGHIPPLRRQSFHEPFHRGHPGMGALLNRELPEHIDEFDDDDALFAAQFQHGHRASAPALLPPVPFYRPVHRGSMSVAPIVNPNVFTNRQMMVNPNVTMNPLRPYSYATDQSSMAGMYPHINQDLLILSTVGQMRSTERILPIIDILVQRSPTEIEVLRRHFRSVNGGTDLSVAFKNLINISNERSSVRYALMGLALGPALYDSWLIQQQQQVAMTGRPISSTLAAANYLERNSLKCFEHRHRKYSSRRNLPCRPKSRPSGRRRPFQNR